MPIFLYRKPPQKKAHMCYVPNNLPFFSEPSLIKLSTQQPLKLLFFNYKPTYYLLYQLYLIQSINVFLKLFIHLLAGVSLSPDFLSTSLAPSFHLPFFLNIFWSLSNGKAWVSISDFHFIYTLSLSDLFQTQVFNYHLQSDNS